MEKSLTRLHFSYGFHCIYYLQWKQVLVQLEIGIVRSLLLLDLDAECQYLLTKFSLEGAKRRASNTIENEDTKNKFVLIEKNIIFGGFY